MMLEPADSQPAASRIENPNLFTEEYVRGDIANSGPDSSFLLSQLEVYNWGPFRGIHRAQFDPAGTAIIGPTGSGKTTLVDALMTLLVALPRYNLASTGGHESDRTLIEYVRGVLGGDGADGRQEVARPGKTISGICATYIGGEQVVRLAALFWTEGTGNSADDLKRRWVFSLAQEHTFEKWLRMLNDDGVRDLLKMGRETAGLRFFDSKRSYLERVRKFFDVGENAFTLLNRAAGLKQLNSIDEIFRELVLDDKSAFDRAIEVAAEFDNLAAIHAELELARKQQESLVPVQDEHERLLKSREKTQTYRLLKKLLPVWFAQVGEQMWAAEAQRLALRIKSLQLAISADESKANELKSLVDSLREQYLELGGNVIGELENTIAAQKKLVEERRKHAQQYLQMAARFELRSDLSEQALLANQSTLAERQKSEQKECDLQRTKTLEAMSELRDVEKRVNDIEEALAKVKRRPGSNIPPRYQDFRSELASQLSLQDSELPFLAELVEVKPAESAWRGAIERAIGSERLRVLVPMQHLESALHWINHRDNRLHVRLQAAGPRDERLNFFTDGYVSKLNFKTHPLSSAAQQLLSGRDLHCVSSPEMLKDVEHGLTVEGMMSGRRGKFEKQDQRGIDQGWMTGFDNKDQLESLARQLISAGETVEHKRTMVQDQQNQLAQQEEVLKLIHALLELDFSTIDLPSAESELARSRERLKTLLDPDSDASQAKIRYEAENSRLESLRQSLTEQRTEIAVFESKLSDAEHEITKARGRKGKGLTEDELLLANKRFQLDPDMAPKRLRDEEDRFAKAVEDKLAERMSREAEIEQQLVRKMELAKRVDSGALTEVGSDIEDVPFYLERLRVLNDEALPEKRTRFLEYLNRSSDQGVTQLLAGIDEEVDAIEQRIGELNQTLVKVDFRESRYLQLQPQRMKDERLRALNIAMQKVRSAALKDDGGESHFRALQGMVAILREAGENRRLQGSKALLDPRFRLQFSVVEVDRKTGDRSPPRSGSQSGSGGEKELMASHILTASLSYALCPAAATRPLYGTVILDEAFSKSSPSAASRIIEALRIFRLHPIFVTPNKEISLLKQHTRKVICVQRPNKEASLTSISWEKLEQLARTQ
ncbi:MAG: hypothetical protein NXI32_04260 [bacterium]|nr:hypothetical protein [bacterium]